MTESPPWSHPIAWSAAGTVDSRLLLQADVDVRDRVARFLHLEGVGKLEATVSARAWLDGMELNGRVVATLTRLCGVSLEAFQEVVENAPPGSARFETPLGAYIQWSPGAGVGSASSGRPAAVQNVSTATMIATIATRST